MSDIEVISDVRKKITVRPWADGKKLLISKDEDIKSEMIQMRAEENGTVELLTDPDIRVVAEDMEGPMLVIADPKRLAIVYNLESGRLRFVECCPAEDEDDE